MKKQPEITEATRRDFISAFCDCYAERPIEKITVKEVAERAGYSRVTFYNYFNDVYDLLEQIEDEFISQIANGIGRSIEADRDFRNFVYAFQKLIAENEFYSQIFLKNSRHSHFFVRLKDRIIPVALKSLGLSSEQRSAVYALEFYLPGMISMISCWLKNDRDMPAEDLAELVRGILQDGLLSQLH